MVQGKDEGDLEKRNGTGKRYNWFKMCSRRMAGTCC